jgi:prevent-host-death family protein
MVKKISARTAQATFGELIEDVSARGDQYVIERGGRPVAAVVPVWQLRGGQKRRDRFFRMVETIQQRTRGVKRAVIRREVAEAVRAVRARTRRPKT